MTRIKLIGAAGFVCASFAAAALATTSVGVTRSTRSVTSGDTPGRRTGATSLPLSLLVRNLTHGQRDSNPTWSPDGLLIAFNRGSSIHVIHADGSDLGRPRLLVRSGIQPSWGT